MPFLKFFWYTSPPPKRDPTHFCFTPSPPLSLEYSRAASHGHHVVLQNLLKGDLWHPLNNTLTKDCPRGSDSFLHRAISKGHLLLIKVLVEYARTQWPGFNILNCEWRPLTHAVKCGQLEIVQYFFEEIPNPPHIDSPCRTRDKRTLLAVGASLGHLSVVKYLLEKQRASINGVQTPTTSLSTPLYNAVKGRQLAAALYLGEYSLTPPLHTYTLSHTLSLSRFYQSNMVRMSIWELQPKLPSFVPSNNRIGG